MDIGNQIRNRRTELHMTQDELANKLHVVRTAVSNWENGRNYPDLQMIVQISEVLDISLDQLLKGDEKVVEQIGEDTQVRKKQGKQIVILKVVIIALAALVILAGISSVYRRYFSAVDSEKEISEMYVGEDNVLHISLNLPFWETISSYMADNSKTEEGEIAIEIDKTVNWRLDRHTTIEIPVYTEGDGLFSENFIKNNGITKIAIVNRSAEEVYSLELQKQ